MQLHAELDSPLPIEKQVPYDVMKYTLGQAYSYTQYLHAMYIMRDCAKLQVDLSPSGVYIPSQLNMEVQQKPLFSLNGVMNQPKL